MLHHLASAIIQVANLVNYNCHPREEKKDPHYPILCKPGAFYNDPSLVQVIPYNVHCT